MTWLDYSDGLVRNEDGTIRVWVVVVREQLLPARTEVGKWSELRYREVLREGFTTELRARNFAADKLGDGRLVHLETLSVHMPGES